jgi:hypothetical protein
MTIAFFIHKVKVLALDKDGGISGGEKSNIHQLLP